MSTTALQPATTPIPVQLSEPEFTAFILPHLSMPKRGPKCKLGYYRVFNLILRVLYTPTVSPLMIPLGYCHINSFQRVLRMEKPFPGGEKRIDGWASPHVEL